MSKRILLPIGLVVALAVFGTLTGPIGIGFLKAFGLPTLSDEPLIHKPEIELAASKLFGPVTNTMLASWLTIIVLVLIFFLATRRAKLVPGRFQALVETIVETLLTFVESVIGKEKARMVFPLVATIFLFVAFNAWLGLLPIYGTIFLEHGEGTEAHLLRNPNTDVNLPLALAIVAFVAIETWGIRSIGLGKYAGQFVNLKAVIQSPMIGGIQILVGLLEILSHFIRLISFTFRLFGNMTAGEILLLVITFLVGFTVPVVFYSLELLVGFVQALIFAGLTLVFTTIAITPHEEEEHGGAH
ncbi:MAG: F0F1 ATP synthase subunit A [Chloroflexi bacterium]|nr:F0F1 ATP synthase subunit A [Chloroflexota bacterium]